MLEKFLDTIKKYNMLENNDSVLVGLSGGADSVCLLLNLLEIKDLFNLNISAIHCNHQLRGEESDNDEFFCIELCKKLNVPLIICKLNVTKYATESGKSIEEAARDLRYAEFSSHVYSGKIVTAHNLSDNAETVIFNLTRGTGLKGLCGIPPIRDNIIRPLITSSRTEIEEYLLEKNQLFVTDKTNLSDNYSRNKIRLKVIPELKKINYNILDNIGNVTQLLKIENNYLEIAAKKVYNNCKLSDNSLNTEILRTEHPAIRRRCIALFLKNNSFEQSFDRISAIDNIIQYNGKINLSKNVYIESKMGIISIVKTIAKIPAVSINMKLGINDFLGKKVNIRLINKDKFTDEINVNKKFAINYLDYDKIQGKVVLRNRRDGDKIQLLNRNFESSVKKLFNAKIPIEKRSSQVFLADEAGVVFIEDIGISDRVNIDGDTENILKIVIDRSVPN